MLQDEYEMIERLDGEALKILKAARIVLLQNYAFYGTLVSAMPLICNFTWLETAATDHRNIYYNPEFIVGMPEARKKKVFARVDADPKMDAAQKAEYKEYIESFYRKKTVREVVFILMHEIRHVTNDHMSRGKSFNPKKYNIAADHYINTDLVYELGPKTGSLKFFPDGKQTVFDKKKEFGFMSYAYCDFKYAGMTAEKIYSLLPDDQSSSCLPKGGQAHIGEYDPNSNILGYTDMQPKKSTVERDEDLTWSSGMIDAALKACGGEGPKEARELIASMCKPKINYLQIIKQRMISRVKSHLTYRRPARRSGSVTYTLRRIGAINNSQYIVLPGREKQKMLDIVIAFDVSGSISKKTLDKIFNEIIGLCSLYPQFRVTLFCWSTRVGDVKVYTKDNIKEMLDYKVTSTGGTHASCALDYIEQNIPDAKEVIIFTDGYIEDLKHRVGWGKKYPTLWVICGGKKDWEAPFGRAVDLDEYK